MWGWIGGAFVQGAGRLIGKFIREIIILLLLAVVFLTAKCSKEKDGKIGDLNLLYKTSKSQLEQWRDNAGKNHSRAVAAEIEAKNVNYVLDEDLKALKKEIGNLKKNLISYSKISTVTDGRFSVPLKDTIVVVNDLKQVEAKVAVFKDDYIEFRQLITQDSSITHYSIKNDFEYYHYYRKPGKFPFNIFKRKEAVAEITFKNPNTRGDRIYSLVFKRKRKSE
jgi:hypothetical protein